MYEASIGFDWNAATSAYFVADHSEIAPEHQVVFARSPGRSPITLRRIAFITGGGICS
jgi:hypothetical protein